MAIQTARVDGRATRWTGQHQRRREEFVEAALVAIAQHGPDVSTEQIAAEAGVARTRLYKHFAGAGDLNRAIGHRAFQLVTAELEPVWNPQGTPAQMIDMAIGTHLRWLTEHRNLYRYLTKHSAQGGPGDGDVVADVKTAIAGHLTELLAGYLSLLDTSRSVAEPLAFGLVGFVDSAANRWVEHNGDISLEEMVEHLARWVWAIIDDTLRAVGVELDPQVPILGTRQT